MFDVHGEDTETGLSVLSTLGRKACLSKKNLLQKPSPMCVRLRALCDLCDAPRIVPISVQVLIYINNGPESQRDRLNSGFNS